MERWKQTGAKRGRIGSSDTLALKQIFGALAISLAVNSAIALVFAALIVQHRAASKPVEIVVETHLDPPAPVKHFAPKIPLPAPRFTQKSTPTLFTPAPKAPRSLPKPLTARFEQAAIPASTQNAAMSAAPAPAPTAEVGRDVQQPAPRQASGGAANTQPVPAADPKPIPAPTPPQPIQTPQPALKPSTPARILAKEKPQYPESARRDEVQGATALIVTIDASGRASKVEIAKSSGDRRLDDAAKKSVQRWTFSPKIDDGIAQNDATLRVNIVFELDDK